MTADSGWRVAWRLSENIDDDRREKADKHDDEADGIAPISSHLPGRLLQSPKMVMEI